MLGDRVPVSLKIFLTALAVVDDLGAILVIALFYGGQLHWDYLAAALLVMALVYAMNRMGEEADDFLFRSGRNGMDSVLLFGHPLHVVGGGHGFARSDRAAFQQELFPA